MLVLSASRGIFLMSYFWTGLVSFIAGSAVVFFTWYITSRLRTPRPKVILGSETNVALKETIPPLETDVNAELDSVVKNFQPFHQPTDGLKGSALASLKAAFEEIDRATSRAMLRYSPGEVERYERERLEYFEEYESYLKLSKWLSYAKESLIIRLDIEVENKRSNVEGLYAELYFPDEVQVFSEDDFMAKLEAPEEPTLPRNQFQMIPQPKVHSLDVMQAIPRQIPTLSENVSALNIVKATLGWKVSFTIDEIHSDSKESCGLLFVSFESFKEIPKQFIIKWCIRAKNIPGRRRRGKLAIKTVKICSRG